MNAIIFGINGQDGYYLRRVLDKENISIVGISRSEGDWIKGDISDFCFVEPLIKNIHPDYIFHLAANSATRHDVLFENHETIATGTLNILEAVKRHCPLCKVFITGSGVQFKNEGKPIRETNEFEGNSPYSVSRIQSVYASRYYRKLGLQVYVGYLFHHESPLRKANHVSKCIINSLLRIKNGSEEKIELGDINVKKEWAYAKDICEGIFTLMNQDKVYEACIGTGKLYSIEDWLEVCFKQFNMNWQEHVVLKNNFTSEYVSLVSDPTTINQLGWHAKTSFGDLSRIMINNSL